MSMPPGPVSFSSGNPASHFSNHCFLLSSGGVPPNFDSSSLSVAVGDAFNSSWMTSYRFITASTKDRPAFSAMAAQAVRKPFLPMSVRGPGLNSSPDEEPLDKRTPMQVMLSFESVCTALWHTAVTASPMFLPSLSMEATSFTTSSLGKLPSETPSHTSSRKSVSSHSMCRNSGSTVTGRSSGPGPPVAFSSLSPKPRLTARFPLTRATPPSAISTLPPQRSIRARSFGWSGLWSVVSPLSVPPPSTMVPSRLPSRTRLSPALITSSWCFPAGALGFFTTHIVAVEPLACSESRNS
mmetsp:Transcript_53434/g.116657  ORF Transcript_53434/g.116657 Transcript_53434/m.116657 type:complete len:296 (+) Transcript_53434:472-1359(+)